MPLGKDSEDEGTGEARSLCGVSCEADVGCLSLGVHKGGDDAP